MQEKKAKKVLDHVKSTYDNIAEEFAESRNYIGKEFKHFLPYLKGQIIDLGCGNGRFAAFLDTKKITCDYLGIDNNSKFLQIAKKTYPKRHFIEGDQLSMPVEDNSVDTLLNIRAFHHIPSKNLRRVSLLEMRRTLKKDGILIISVWNLWQKKYWKQLAAAILRSIFTLGTYEYNDTFIPWKGKDKRYYHAFTKSELKKSIEKADFTILKLFEVGKDIIIIAKK